MRALPETLTLFPVQSMLGLGAFLLAGMAVPNSATAFTQADFARCANEADAEPRLACYDALIPPPGTTEEIVSEGSTWTVSQYAREDGTVLRYSLYTDSVDPVPVTSGADRNGRLTLECAAGETTLALQLAGELFEVGRSFGLVTASIDGNAVQLLNLAGSDQHRAMGLWEDSLARPWIERMLDKGSLSIRATLESGASHIAEFPISGLREALIPLQTQCALDQSSSGPWGWGDRASG